MPPTLPSCRTITNCAAAARTIAASGEVLLTGLTDAGYHEMSVLLKKYGLNVPADPDIRIHLLFPSLLEKLFNKRPQLDPYTRLFTTTSSPETEAMIKKLNEFMRMALPFIKAGTEPDGYALAKKAGLDAATAKDFLKISLEKLKDMWR